MNNTN